MGLGAAEGVAELPHRDIYSGMVAEELAKGGAFGREESRYGFCFWSEARGFGQAIFESEDECARQQLRCWMLSGFVSDRVCCRARVYDDAPEGATAPSCEGLDSDPLFAASDSGSREALAGDASRAAASKLEQSVIALLQGEPLAKLKADVEARCPRESAAGEVIDAYAADYLGIGWDSLAEVLPGVSASCEPGGALPAKQKERSLPGAQRARRQEGAMLVAGMLAFARHLGLVSGDYRREFAQGAADALLAPAGAARYGFVIRGDGAPKAYSNAYFAAAWDRWRNAAASGLPAGTLSAIIRIPSFDDVAAPRRKEKANAYLLALFNSAYFETLDILHALAS